MHHTKAYLWLITSFFWKENWELACTYRIVCL